MTANLASIMGARIECKHPEDLVKIPTLDGRLQFVLELLAMWAGRRGAYVLRVTDVDTPGVHMQNGPHYRRQAVDIGFGPLTKHDCEAFARWLNGTLDYGRGFNVAIIGAFDPRGRHETHMHLQVPPPFQAERTIRIF